MVFALQQEELDGNSGGYMPQWLSPTFDTASPVDVHDYERLVLPKTMAIF